MNKSLFESIKTVPLLPPPSPSNLKLLVGVFFVAVILSASLAIANIPLSVRGETSIPKPVVPEFTVKFVDASYDVPTTYSIDPYTGANVTHPSHRVDNKTIELTITNQPFVSTNTGGWNTLFYYNVRIKGNYAENWINLYSPAVVPLNPSNSDYTVLSFPLTLSPTQPEQGYSLESYDTTTDSYSSRLTGLPSNAQIDFQVEAMIGYVSRTVEFASWHFTGETSGWSSTQTITIPASSTPEIPEFPSGIILPLLIIVAIGVGLLVHFKKRKH